MTSFIELVPDVNHLLALEVEDLAEVVMQVVPSLLQGGRVYGPSISESAFARHGIGPGYPENTQRRVSLAVAEAVSWLETQGLLMPDPGQHGRHLCLTRRGEVALKQGGVSAYRWGRFLPTELLHPGLAEKVKPLFLRGDYDVAVFQAFKLVEVAVRSAANSVGADFPDNAVGTDLMRRAFTPRTGPLANTELAVAEQEALSSLFAGAIGHAKNPTGHREVEISPMEAARLILFASYLLDLVWERSHAASI